VKLAHGRDACYHPNCSYWLLTGSQDRVDGKGTGIRWISARSLEDLEYADHLALLSDSFDHIQEKT